MTTPMARSDFLSTRPNPGLVHRGKQNILGQFSTRLICINNRSWQYCMSDHMEMFFSWF